MNKFYSAASTTQQWVAPAILADRLVDRIEPAGPQQIDLGLTLEIMFVASATLSTMAEKCDQNDERNRHTQQEKQN
jgi:hypothetical protein